jgi:hypothetical protein
MMRRLAGFAKRRWRHAGGGCAGIFGHFRYTLRRQANIVDGGQWE